MSSMYPDWQIVAGDVSTELNRYYTPEEKEIVRAAEDCGYTRINVEDNEIEACDENGRRCTIARL